MAARFPKEMLPDNIKEKVLQLQEQATRIETKPLFQTEPSFVFEVPRGK